jgi:hypothetical protein
MQNTEPYIWTVCYQTRTEQWCLLYDGEVSAIFNTEEQAYKARWAELTDEEQQAITDEIDLDNDMQAEAAANRRLSYTP